VLASFRISAIAVIESGLAGLCWYTDVVSFTTIYDCPTCVSRLVVSVFSINGFLRFLVTIGEVNEWKRNHFALVLALIPCRNLRLRIHDPYLALRATFFSHYAWNKCL
jgi:hypothetical protein